MIGEQQDELKAIDAAGDTGSQVDPLVALAETALAGAPGADGPVRPPVEVMVHVDAQTLQGTWPTRAMASPRKPPAGQASSVSVRAQLSPSREPVAAAWSRAKGGQVWHEC